MQYRSEIDGLRAMAVVPVILFHANFSVFSGGFVGVDVFFVISGYLITSLLLGDLERGRFSLLHFYERRVRRIFPALFLVVACCVPPAWLLMLPDQFKDFSQSVGAVILFVSNFLFWQESGYFDGAAELKPLLHTWSLAVEEQYYVVFPILLAFLWRFGRTSTFVVLAALALASLALTEWGWRSAATANFFLAPFRIWELLAGALCAIWLRYGRVPSGGLFDLLGVLGLAMIAAAVLSFDRTTPFPSLHAILPVAGSCLVVLFAQSGSYAAWVLSLPPVVWIGLVSYSAYLWHQPLFAFARLASPVVPPSWVMLSLSLLSLGLAYLSWRFVEQPFRRREVPIFPDRGGLFTAAAACGVLFLVIGALGHIREGFPQRFDTRLQDVLAVRAEWSNKRAQCHVEGEPRPHPVEQCLRAPGGGTGSVDRIDVALIGDSHSLAISQMVQDELAKRGWSSYAVSYTGCIGLPGFFRVDLDATHECERHNREILDYLRSEGVNTLVLTSRFPLYVSGERFDNGEGGRETGDSAWIDLSRHRAERAGRKNSERKARVLAGMSTSIQALLEEFNLVLVYPIPEAGWDVVRVSVKHTLRDGGKPLEVSTSTDAYVARNAAVTAMFDALEHPKLETVKPAALLCDTMIPGRCANAVGSVLYYRDEDHLSYAGAKLLAPAIARAVGRLKDPDS